MARVLLVALLVVPVFAGCLAAEDDGALLEVQGGAASRARFDVLRGESVWIASSKDGAKLHARLFLPDVSSEPSWKAPTILVMSPYFGFDAREDDLDPASRPTYFRYKWLIDEFVPRGYAVAFADVRGTGDSGGCLEQTAQLQWQDGYDTVEWLAAKEWSNGKVGMFGKSYDGETQQATAVLAPPHLATIVPVSSVAGQYDYSFYDGVPYTGFPFVPSGFVSNFFYMATDGLQPPTSREGLSQFATRAGCHPAMLRQGLDTVGDWNSFWEEREIRRHVASVRASVLYVHGLQDWNVKPSNIREWFELIPSTKRAILGQWAHDYPEENRWVPEWSRLDWRDVVVRWYDHFLLDLDTGILDALAPVEVQDSRGIWRREETFPPMDTVPRTFHLGEGALSESAPEGELALRLRENQEGYASVHTGLMVPTAPSGDLVPELVFESEPLASEVRWSGWPTLTMNFTLTETLSGRKDLHFAAHLYSVDPQGAATWLNSAYLSGRHREGVDAPSDVPLGDPVEYRMRFFPSDTVVEAGHSLRLVLSGSDDWTELEGSFWAGTLAAGALALPTIDRDMETVRLDVPLGDPVRS